MNEYTKMSGMNELTYEQEDCRLEEALERRREKKELNKK